MKSTTLIFGSLFINASILATPIATGKLVLEKGLKDKAKGIRTVFFSVYDPKSPTPMPCAAQKFTLEKDADGEFLNFSLDSGLLKMMACEEIPVTMRIKAKLDKDGSAGPDNTGDITGTLNDVKKGSADLKITLDKAF